MQAWGLTLEQVVEAALKSADMDVASVDFLVLHQVRRSKRVENTNRAVLNHACPPAQHTGASLSTAEAATVTRCGSVGRHALPDLLHGVGSNCSPVTPRSPTQAMLLGGCVAAAPQECGPLRSQDALLIH